VVRDASVFLEGRILASPYVKYQPTVLLSSEPIYTTRVSYSAMDKRQESININVIQFGVEPRMSRSIYQHTELRSQVMDT